MKASTTLAVIVFLILSLARHSHFQAAEPGKRDAITAKEVIELWTPIPKDATDFGKMGGSPEADPKVAAFSFRAVGSTYEEYWNFYADLCGIKQRFAEKKMVVSPGKGPKGSYVVSDRAAVDGSGHAVSVFLLKTDQYTITATLHPSAGGKGIEGSLTAVVP